MGLIRLMKHEYQFPLVDLSPTTFISFYTKNEDKDFIDVLSFLSTRFTEILKSNPWLTGRLVRQEQDGESGVYLSFEEIITDSKDYFKVITDENVFTLTDGIALTDYLAPMKPKGGRDCIDKDEKLAQLTVFQNTERNKLAVMFCLNHTVGDGSTCYSIWKMLGKDQRVESMVVERYHDMMDALQWGMNPFKALVGLLGRGLKRKICRKGPPLRFIYRVNSDEVKKQKSTHNADLSFVSTNDILCTWFFGTRLPTDGFYMVVNLRERIPEIMAGNMAGNYITACPVNFTGITSPHDFRDKWTCILSKEAPADKVNVTGAYNFSMNLLTSYHQVEIPGYSHCVHLPLFSQSDFWTDILGIHVASDCFLTPFHLNNDEVGVIMCTYNGEMTEQYFDRCQLLESQVSL